MADQETDEPKKKGGLVKIIGLVHLSLDLPSYIS